MQAPRDVPRRNSTRPDPLTLTHADHWRWYPWIDPARSHHVVRTFHGTPDRLTKCCGGRGAVLTGALPRCRATNKTSRQCRLPIRADLGSSTCAAHRAEVRR